MKINEKINDFESLFLLGNLNCLIGIISFGAFKFGPIILSEICIRVISFIEQNKFTQIFFFENSIFIDISWKNGVFDYFVMSDLKGQFKNYFSTALKNLKLKWNIGNVKLVSIKSNIWADHQNSYNLKTFKFWSIPDANYIKYAFSPIYRMLYPRYLGSEFVIFEENEARFFTILGYNGGHILKSIKKFRDFDEHPNSLYCDSIWNCEDIFSDLRF